jgi:hypothetical protein
VPGDDVPSAPREEEDDNDLLTYGEAGARLSEEIARARRLVESLEHGDVAADAAGLESARRRLSELEEAAARHTQQRIRPENFERFFGYTGTPRRLTD